MMLALPAPDPVRALAPLIDLEARQHAPTCLVLARDAGEDGWDFGSTTYACTCGLSAALSAAGERCTR